MRHQRVDWVAPNKQNEKRREPQTLVSNCARNLSTVSSSSSQNIREGKKTAEESVTPPSPTIPLGGGCQFPQDVSRTQRIAPLHTHTHAQYAESKVCRWMEEKRRTTHWIVGGGSTRSVCVCVCVT